MNASFEFCIFILSEDIYFDECTDKKEKRKAHFTEFSSSSYLAMLVFPFTVLKNTHTYIGGCFFI